MTEQRIRVVITDDHPVVLKGMQQLLQTVNDVELVGQYADAGELLESLKQDVPDILLLDIKMPGITGDDLALMLAEKYPALKILALTCLDSAYYTRLMMKRGVRGYILKTADEKILLDAIRIVQGGDIYIQEVLKEKLVQAALGQKKEADAEPVLSKRELEVLKLIASEHSSQEIADKLFISRKTVENHRANMLLKMKVRNAPSLIKKAIELNML